MSEMQKPDDCPHDDWIIKGTNSVRPQLEGTCKLCGKALPLYVLLNNWKERVERELRAAAVRNGSGE